MHILDTARKDPANLGACGPDSDLIEPLRISRHLREPKRFRLHAMVMTGLVAVLLLQACTAGDAAICSGRVLSQSRDAPAAEGPSVSGDRQVSIAGYLGRPLIVNYWASWCGPCRTEMPMLSEASKRFEAEGVSFVGVNIRDDRAAAASFEREFGVGYPSIFDPDAAIAAKWEVIAPPSTFAVSPEGRIVAVIPGPVDQTDLSCMIEVSRGAA